MRTTKFKIDRLKPVLLGGGNRVPFDTIASISIDQRNLGLTQAVVIPQSDVPAPYGWKPILPHKIVNSYRAFFTNTTQLEELRRRFEAYTSPVKNARGVR